MRKSLVLIREDGPTYVGMGNRQGYISTKYYKCPCGKGQVIEDNDDVIGHRYRHVSIECESCKMQYEIIGGDSRSWNIRKIVPRCFA